MTRTDVEAAADRCSPNHHDAEPGRSGVARLPFRGGRIRGAALLAWSRHVRPEPLPLLLLLAVIHTPLACGRLQHGISM